ncbi:MAG: helix-turn-helix transcriptional regulator [Ruminococcaceae bacterium]|nr:helix-turn-helix transcriptional regulator [Oscillospiraceae bacterium]
MKQPKSSNYFWFRQISSHRYRYTDVRHGAAMHFLVYLRKGRARFVGRDRTVTIEQGQFMYIPEGEAYQSYWQAEEEILFDSLGFHWFPEGDSAEYTMQIIPADDSMIALADAISQNRQVCSENLGYFFALLSAVVPKMATSGAEGDVLQKAQLYLYLHPEASIAEVAANCAISQSGLYNAFARSGWGTPNDLRQRIRAEMAVELLQTTDLSVEEISTRLSFSSASYFRKILKKHTGKTPSQLRKEAALV